MLKVKNYCCISIVFSTAFNGGVVYVHVLYVSTCFMVVLDLEYGLVWC